jgi:hypothetical protein
LANAAFAQNSLDRPKPKAPSVELVTTGPIAISKYSPTKFSLTFRVAPGFHVNSHTPHSENLIPTSLKLDPPQDIVAGRITYPAGQDLSFEFSPDEKLNVYEGDFTIAGLFTTTNTVNIGTYKLRGTLSYQACDNRQCFPPKQTPIDLDVRVQGAPKKAPRKPGQSPHVH